MACTRPLKAYRAPGGGIAFDSKRGFEDRKLELACGQCQECRLARSAQWALRCVHEAATHRHNSFITLTYSPESLPANWSLDVREWQLFAKRLRKERGKFRYYHAGEYGSKTGRPHYHALLFGLHFPDQVVIDQKNGKRIFTSPQLEEIWGKGNVTVGDVCFESAAYVARYVMKKITGDDAEEHYERVDPDTGEIFPVKPEYSTMSRRPGIGKAWLQKFKSDVYPSDEVIHEGRKFRPPRFYDSLLPEKELQKLKRQRRKTMQEHSENLTPERLEAREKITETRLGLSERRLST